MNILIWGLVTLTLMIYYLTIHHLIWGLITLVIYYFTIHRLI